MSADFRTKTSGVSLLNTAEPMKTSVSETIRKPPLGARQSLNCIKNMANNDFQYAGWNYYTLQRGTIITLISPGNCALQCGRWLWDDIPWNSPNVRHIGILHLVTSLTISLQSTCHSAPVCESLSKSDHLQLQQKKIDVMSIFKMGISAILALGVP